VTSIAATQETTARTTRGARLTASAEWRLLSSLRHGSPPLAATWWVLIAVRGFLPAAFAVAMGALIAAIGAGDALGPPLVALAVVFIALNTLGPVHSTIGAMLGSRAGAWLHDRLMSACIEPDGLAHLERPDLADDLALARDFDLGITAPPLEVSVREIGDGFAQVAGGIALCGVLATYRWWAGVAIGFAWASTHVLLRESALWKVWHAEGVTKQQRHVDYAYRLGVDPPAAKEIRVFGLADWAVERYAKLRRRFTDIIYAERRLRQRPLGWSLALLLAGNAVVFWSLGRDATAGLVALDSLVVYAQAAVGASALAFGELDWWFRGSAAPIPKVLDIAGRMREAGRLQTTGSREATSFPSSQIHFEGVRFTYPTTGVKVLEGFDLTIPAGGSMAIVGPNGAGKTTLAKLICRLYDPQDGAVRVDGIDLRDLDITSWRQRVAAVFQDFVRYELDLRTNVAPFGAPDEEVTRALERAGADHLATLDTVMSRAYRGGTDVSGGQWQRIALARALCAVQLGAGVVLLDEPTAQLDVRGEAEIFDRILEATKGCTTILISHRFSTVRHADLICVLDEGHVKELGSHDELMALGGRYRKMFDLQASRFYHDEGDSSS
jgi:ATP-binding cassette, subfamily B, bacterial